MWHNRIKCDIMHPLAVQTQPNGKTERQKCYKRLFTKCPYEKAESKPQHFSQDALRRSYCIAVISSYSERIIRFSRREI